MSANTPNVCEFSAFSIDLLVSLNSVVYIFYRSVKFLLRSGEILADFPHEEKGKRITVLTEES